MIARYIYKKIYGPLFMDGVQVPQGSRATMRSLPEIPGTHWINLRRLKR